MKGGEKKKKEIVKKLKDSRTRCCFSRCSSYEQRVDAEYLNLTTRCESNEGLRTTLYTGGRSSECFVIITTATIRYVATRRDAFETRNGRFENGVRKWRAESHFPFIRPDSGSERRYYFYSCTYSADGGADRKIKQKKKIIKK